MPEQESKKQLAAREALDIIEEISALLVSSCQYLRRIEIDNVLEHPLDA